MKLIKNNKEKGFTLIELVVVIAILAVLALILIPAISGYTTKANEQKNKANAKSIYTSAMLVNADNPYGEPYKQAEGSTYESFKEEVAAMSNTKEETFEISKAADGSLIITLTDTDPVVQYPEE